MDLPQTSEASLTPVSSTPQRRSNQQRRIELLAVAAFVLVNLLAPVLCGELYPFTVSPMFSDQPSAYCTYEILASDGKSLELEPFGLHLVYDGNPPGLGMGIVPRSTLHEFGEVCDERIVLDRVRQTMQDAAIVGPLTVKRTHVEGGANQLKTTTQEWTVTGAESL